MVRPGRHSSSDFLAEEGNSDALWLRDPWHSTLRMWQSPEGPEPAEGSADVSRRVSVTCLV